VNVLLTCSSRVDFPRRTCLHLIVIFESARNGGYFAGLFDFVNTCSQFPAREPVSQSRYLIRH